MAKHASKNKASRGKAKPASGKSVAKPVKKPVVKSKAAKAAKPKSAVGKLVSKVLTKVKAAVKGKPAKAKPVKAAPKAKVKAKAVAKPKPAAKPAPKAALKPAPKAKAVVAPKAKPVVAPKAKPVVAPKAVHPASKAAPATSAKSATPARPANIAMKTQGKNIPSAYVPMVASPRPSGRVAVAVTQPITRPKRRSEQYTAEGKKAPRTPVNLPAGYKPGAKESYMSDFQLEYFRRKLLTWREELVEESKQTIDNLREEVRDVGDEAERATRETENSLELRTRDRYRKLIGKIDKALRRIEDGEYGYCEETGEEIGLDRLEARPIATLCLDAQERWEHRQRQMGD
jgi:DnaK suppressor protein